MLFRIINGFDGTDFFDVDARNAAEAAEIALEQLGWYVLRPYTPTTLDKPKQCCNAPTDECERD